MKKIFSIFLGTPLASLRAFFAESFLGDRAKTRTKMVPARIERHFDSPESLERLRNECVGSLHFDHAFSVIDMCHNVVIHVQGFSVMYLNLSRYDRNVVGAFSIFQQYGGVNLNWCQDLYSSVNHLSRPFNKDECIQILRGVSQWVSTLPELSDDALLEHRTDVKAFLYVQSVFESALNGQHTRMTFKNFPYATFALI